MLIPDALDDLSAEVARINSIPLAEAERLVALVGDTPEIDDTDYTLVTVRDAKGVEVAKILWPQGEE